MEVTFLKKMQVKTLSFKFFLISIVLFFQGDFPKSSSVPLTVEVLSTSSGNPPVFNAVPTNLAVIENIDLNYNVTTVTARSSNGGTLTYFISGGNVGGGFDINPTTGRIYISGVVDYEVVQQYHLWVEARQSPTLSSFIEVVINVEDKNDNWPRFTETLYNVSIDEDAIWQSDVVTVKAVDMDSKGNGRVTYSLSGPGANMFRIDENTGEIVTYAFLDRETTDLYSLTVTAVDNVSGTKMDSASICIILPSQTTKAMIRLCGCVG